MGLMADSDRHSTTTKIVLVNLLCSEVVEMNATLRHTSTGIVYG